jgi:transmembrane sensor
VRRDGATGLRVVVTQGLVRLESTPDSSAATLLPPGSVARLAGDALEVRHLPVEQARELLSWREGFVVFHGTPLADAAEEFNRYNTRKLVIGDPGIAHLRVGGQFRWSNEEAFVRLIEQVFPVRSEVRDTGIVLLARKSDTHAH